MEFTTLLWFCSSVSVSICFYLYQFLPISPVWLSPPPPPPPLPWLGYLGTMVGAPSEVCSQEVSCFSHFSYHIKRKSLTLSTFCDKYFTYCTQQCKECLWVWEVGEADCCPLVSIFWNSNRDPHRLQSIGFTVVLSKILVIDIKLSYVTLQDLCCSIQWTTQRSGGMCS